MPLPTQSWRCPPAWGCIQAPLGRLTLTATSGLQGAGVAARRQQSPGCIQVVLSETITVISLKLKTVPGNVYAHFFIWDMAMSF